MPAKVDFRDFDDKGRPEVKILTYNIWFEKISKERISEVMKVIEEADADFICPQEVTDETRTMIYLSDLVKQRYLGVGGTISGN